MYFQKDLINVQHMTSKIRILQTFMAPLIILVGERYILIFDQWSKLYFSLDTQPDIQIFN